MQSRKHTGLFQLIFTFILSCVSFLLIETIYRGGLTGFTKWITTYSLNAIYLLLFLFLLFGILHFFNKKGYFLFFLIFNLLFGILAFASRTKELLRGDPLIPVELKLGSEAKNMLAFFASYSLPTILLIGLGLVIILGVIVFLFKRIKNNKRVTTDYLFPAISLLLFVGFIFQDIYFTNGVVKNVFSIKVNPYNQKENYFTNGILLSFIRNLEDANINDPSNYSKKTIHTIIDNIDYDLKRDNKVKPNIIFIMSEAFWDPNVMDSVTFNKDPLPNFHKLTNSYSSGTLTVPVYGGSTSNTEFEVLTGFTNQFLPAGATPYKDILKQPIPALPNILKNQGYTSVGIHPYHNWFYDRNSIYKKLGFDNFISLEFFPSPVKDMMYYRDNELTDEVIKQIKDSDKPNFIYAITMQNHGPYRTDAKKFYATMEAENKNGAFSPEAENILEFYSDNLVEVDKELSRLVSTIEKTEEPSIIVFFGDHLPLLGENYQVYKEAGYFQGESSYEDYQKIYQTPILIWDNLGLEKENINLSSNFLGSHVLDLAGLKGYYLNDFLNSLSKENKNNLPRLDYQKQSALDESDIMLYKQLQHDILSGNGYGLSKEKVNYNPSKNYRLGFGDPQIKDATFKTYKKRKAILLEGEHFSTSCQIYINGEPVDSTFINSETMYAFIPKSVKSKDIQMKIFDSQNTLLSSSNKWELK